MPTKSNNTGGQGGKRPGAGRKPKGVAEKAANGNPGGRKLTVLDIPDMEGTDMPKPDEILSATQKDGTKLKAAEIYEAVWHWLEKLNAKTVEEGLSRSALDNYIRADLYHVAGMAITNFDEKLPADQGRIAQEILKGNYDLGFVSLPKDYDEVALEDALEQRMTRFLLELGTGWAFIGRQKEIIISGKTRKIDLLFYHIYLRSYNVPTFMDLHENLCSCLDGFKLCFPIKLRGDIYVECFKSINKRLF